MGNDQIWAPWRLSYVQHDKSVPESQLDSTELLPGASPTCFLCRAAASADFHRTWVVHRGPLCVTLLNRYPYNNGHLLVAPRRHVGRLADLDRETHLELSLTVARMTEILRKLLNAHGFNVGLNLGQAAGAGVPDHLHWHIVPRWLGDTSFMPTLAGINVIPQSLEELWQALTTELQTGAACGATDSEPRGPCVAGE